jgi:hypothetical protein
MESLVVSLKSFLIEIKNFTNAQMYEISSIFCSVKFNRCFKADRVLSYGTTTSHHHMLQRRTRREDGPWRLVRNGWFRRGRSWFQESILFVWRHEDVRKTLHSWWPVPYRDVNWVTEASSVTLLLEHLKRWEYKKQSIICYFGWLSKIWTVVWNNKRKHVLQKYCHAFGD